MKRVVLLRHAKSSWSDPKLADHERPLAARGKKDARRVARFVAASDLKLDLVLCSSALRASQTWAELEKRVEPRFGVRITRELYLPAHEKLVGCLEQLPAQVQTVMVVGHNPSLEAFALSIARKGAPNLRAQMLAKFPTAALCVIELSVGVESWGSLAAGCELEGRLSTFVTPKDLITGARSTRAPSKASAIELGYKPRWRSTAARVFEATSGQLRENALGARQGQDSEYVHQMRVAVRRLRTALGLFRGVLPEPVREHLGEELRWLFGLLGPLREYDVVLEQVLSPVDAATGVQVLRESLETQRRVLLEHLGSALGSPRFSRLVGELLEQQACLDRREGSSSFKLKPRLRKRLNKRLRKVQRLEAAVDAWLVRGANVGARQVSVLHALRKQLKKLRYACEFVRTVYPSRAMRRYLRRLGALQDVLGELQDNAVSERLLARHLKHVPGRGVRSNLRAHLQAPLAAGTIRASAALAEAWNDFKKAEPFWR